MWRRATDLRGEKVGTKSELPGSLASYVKFFFDNLETGALFPYEQIAKYWMELLQEKVAPLSSPQNPSAQRSPTAPTASGGHELQGLGVPSGGNGQVNDH